MSYGYEWMHEFQLFSFYSILVLNLSLDGTNLKVTQIQLNKCQDKYKCHHKNLQKYYTQFYWWYLYIYKINNK